MKERLKGIIPPLVSPLDQELKVDEKALEQMINHCVEGGVSGIFVLGSCGEGSALTNEQKMLIVKKSVEFTKGRIPLLAGVLESSTERALETISAYEKMGAEYFVVTVPYYLGPDGQEEIIRHYQFLAEHTRGKLIAYNIPPYVHCDILPETMRELLKISNLIAVKDSTGDWKLFQRALFLNQGRIFSGNEDLCGAGMLFGADGCVPCLANIWPQFFCKMYLWANEGNVEKVLQCQEEIEKAKTVFTYAKNWIAVVKYLCNKEGLIQPWTSRSIPDLTVKEKEQIDLFLKEQKFMRMI